MVSELSQVLPYDKSGGADAGHYLLVICLAAGRAIRTGALGRLDYRAGWYIYVGRAKRNLRQRIARHLRRRKPLRWHIDYLLRHGKVEQVLVLPLEGREECSIAAALVRDLGGRIEHRRFGSSDCGCPGHLVYLAEDHPVHPTALFQDFV
jgi:sugar fermentation stimulation protein A